jgi:hypothetical protein
LPGKIVEEHLKKLSFLTSPRSVLSEKKKICYNKQRMHTYYYGKRIGMIMWSMYACHGNYDAMQLIQIKRNRIPTHIYIVQVIYLPDEFKC